MSIYCQAFYWDRWDQATCRVQVYLWVLDSWCFGFDQSFYWHGSSEIWCCRRGCII